jgi:hypothetical protein
MPKKTFPVQVPIAARKRLAFIAGAHDLDLGAAIAYLVDVHECIMEHQTNNVEIETP